jgi:type VI secretion system protein ImpE
MAETAAELFKQGQLDAAITVQLAAVKADPADQAKRLFLFELLLLAGDLERALRQIEAIHYGDNRDLGLSIYKRFVHAEQTRRQVFRGLAEPKFFGSPPDHCRLRLDALAALKGGSETDASAKLLAAAEQSPRVSGTVNGTAVQEFRDADDLFGNVLEVVVQDQYYWVPLENVLRLKVEKPQYARDLVAMTAHVEVTIGGEGEVLLPALYPTASSDPAVRLGRATDWRSLNGGAVLGLGLRTFAADEEALPLPEIADFQSSAAS